MKRIISLMFALLAIATGAQAKLYDLWIAGIQVTDDNKNNITGPGIEPISYLDGKVWFDGGHNMLILENVRINGYSKEAIKSDIYGLTIRVIGRHNTLKSSSSYGIYQSSNGTLTIEGDAQLEIETYKSGIYINNAYCDLKLKDNIRVAITTQNGAAVGVYGSTTVNGYCYIEGEKSMLMAVTKSGEKTVEGFKDMIMSDDIFLNKPCTPWLGSYYDNDKRCICIGGHPVGNEDGAVVIGRTYDINATNFPDEQMREKVSQLDKDGSNRLERDEIYNTRYFYLDTGSPYNSKNPDLKGLELLYDIVTFDANLLEVESIEFHNSFLENIYIQNGKITDLVVNECPWLRSLWCHGHNLTYLDLSDNKYLIDLSAGRNQLINVKLPSSFPNESVYLSIECNKLTESRMNTFINKLPQNTSGKEHYVNVTTSIGKEYFSDSYLEYYKEEGNVITQAQLQAIRDKGWTPQFTHYYMGEWARSDYYGILYYDVFVDGKIVNDQNKDDIMGDYGGMSYNHDTNTLSIMSDYTFDTNAIQSYIPNLTIKTVDVSTLDCKSDAIDLYANTTITGNHRLAVKSKIGVGIFVDEGKTLTIDNATLEMSAQMPCILGATTTGEQKLNIKDSEIEAHSNSSSVAISGFPAGITFEGCAITEPAGGYVKDGNIVDKDGNWATNVTIQKASTFYPVYVAGRQVHNLNASDVLGDGTVSYNSDTKTLTLNNATINTDDESGIEFRDFGLNLELIGENHVHSVDGYPVYVGYDMRMVGDGSLEAVSDNNNAIYLFWGSLAVKENVKLTARGGKYGISGYATPYGNAGELHVLSPGAVVKASGPEGSIVNIGLLKLTDGIAIETPEGALFNETTGNVELDGVTVTDEVVIASTAYQFVIYDGMTDMTEAQRLLDMAVSFGTLGMSYNALTNELSYEIPGGKQMVVLAEYNHHGDKAFFLSNNLTTDDYIEIVITDEQRTLYQAEVDGMEDAEAKAYYTNLLNNYGRVAISFEIPEEWPTENLVYNIVNNEVLSDEAAIISIGLVLCGALRLDGNQIYDTDGKLLFTSDSETGIVTLGDNVQNGDYVYHRFVHAEREMGYGGTVRSIQLNFFRNVATDIASPAVTHDAEQQRVYNLSGQRVGSSYRGIAVSNGRKVVIK